jgi:putative ABC transport system substrate-binding protein
MRGNPMAARLLALGVLLTVAVSFHARVAVAQAPGKVPRVGCLWAVPAPIAAPYRAAFEAGLRDLGWTPGDKVDLEHRFPEQPEDVPRNVASIVAARVDVILAVTNPVVAAAAAATAGIPIVMVYATDPVGSGFATSLARPGRNITGLTFDTSPDLFTKHLELVKQLVPQARRVEILRNPDWYASTNQRAYVTTLTDAARSLQLPVRFSDVRGPADLKRAMGQVARDRGSVLYAMPDGFVTFPHGPLIAQLATQHRMPSVFGFRESVEAGGLASYGPDILAMPRYAARFVDRLLRGTPVADLPIEQPTKFELVINLNTAKLLGLTIPPSLLLRADKVIE